MTLARIIRIISKMGPTPTLPPSAPTLAPTSFTPFLSPSPSSGSCPHGLVVVLQILQVLQYKYYKNYKNYY